MSSNDPVTAPSNAASEEKRSFPLKLVLGLVVVALAVVFGLQNTESTQVDFLGWSFDAARWLIMVVSLVVGLLLGAVVVRRRRD